MHFHIQRGNLLQEILLPCIQHVQDERFVISALWIMIKAVILIPLQKQ